MAFISAEAVKQFLKAGRATITVVSHKTGGHLTYRVKSSLDGTLYVRRMGQHQDHYLGLVNPLGKFIQTRSSETADKGFHPFVWVWSWLSTGQMPPNCSISHDGTCGKCGKQLTDPESIAIGLGPVCRSRFIAERV